MMARTVIPGKYLLFSTDLDHPDFRFIDLGPPRG